MKRSDKRLWDEMAKARGLVFLRRYESPKLDAVCIAPPYSRRANFMFVNKDCDFQGGFQCCGDILQIRCSIPHSAVASLTGRPLSDLIDLSWVLAGKYTIRYAGYTDCDMLMIRLAERIRVKYRRHEFLETKTGMAFKTR
ncbi:hypothetical protein IP81_07420 [Novosphingobium sp. AAP83]|uniref:hypothetical protein n=1 Tax=Novosphingobium sp. AAP83 TaxID=1523425 RepID=UPI0006B89FDF|nr:hypothetical protein [Novosphingobium sp. AAP83]KPF91888.1 hypothetical protein IP81_07420 [Novosphingobium sp. AAP83]